MKPKVLKTHKPATPKPQARIIDAEPEAPKAEVSGLAIFEGQDLRITPDKKRISVFDVIKATGSKNPHQVWADTTKDFPEVLQKTEDWKFPGARQRETPTVDKRGLYHLLFVLPGKRIAPFRVWAATTLDRVIEGDISLAEEIVNRAAQVADPKVASPTQSNYFDAAQLQQLISMTVAATMQAVTPLLQKGASEPTEPTKPANEDIGNQRGEYSVYEPPTPTQAPRLQRELIPHPDDYRWFSVAQLQRQWGLDNQHFWTEFRLAGGKNRDHTQHGKYGYQIREDIVDKILVQLNHQQR